MEQFNEYRVTGPRPWRDTPVGDTTVLDPTDPSVQRALDCGVLTLVRAASVGLDRVRVKRPKDDAVAPEGDDESVTPEAGGLEQ